MPVSAGLAVEAGVNVPVAGLPAVVATGAAVVVPVLAGVEGAAVLPAAVPEAGGVVAVPLGVDALAAPGAVAAGPLTGMGPIGTVWEGVGAGEDGLTAVPLVPEAGVLAVVGPEAGPLAAGVVLLGVTAVPVFPGTPEVVVGLGTVAGVPVEVGAGVEVLSAVEAVSVFLVAITESVPVVAAVPDGMVTFATLLGVLGPPAVVPGAAVAFEVPEVVGAGVETAGTVAVVDGVSVLGAVTAPVVGVDDLEVSAGFALVLCAAGVETEFLPVPVAAAAGLGARVAEPTLIPPTGRGALVVNPVEVTLVCVPESVPVLEAPGVPVSVADSVGLEVGEASDVIGTIMGRLNRISTPSGVVLQV